jgi:hypothetical protein
MSSAYSVSSNDSASRLILFSFHPELYAIPHPEPTGTIMVTEDIPVRPKSIKILLKFKVE